jgi:NADH-quinone oxidoreductase subunit L
MTWMTFGGAAVLAALAAPAIAFALLAASILLRRPFDERQVHTIVGATMGTGLVAALGVGVAMALTGGPVGLSLGSVLAVRGYHLDLDFAVGPEGAAFLVLDFLLVGLVGRFSASYLHREAGYVRFYTLLLVFAFGVAIVATAAGLDLAFAGWELVGLSSALLIAYFHHRTYPVLHGLRAYAVYRLTDVGLLLALVVLHHELGTTEFARMIGASGPMIVVAGAVLVFGVMGKSAAVPFTGWLPRAMEGPTPSSAIFYGALSVHLGPLLLLRAQPLLDAHIGLRIAVVAIGLLTAAHASMVGRAQTDVKSALAYASAAQVGLILAEVGMGWTTLAIVHVVGHAILRTWQLLRSPNVLAERRAVSALAGGRLGRTGRHWELVLPAALRRRLYALALERWYLDDLLEGAVRVVSTPLRWLDRVDAAWGRALDRAEPARPAEAGHHVEVP